MKRKTILFIVSAVLFACTSGLSACAVIFPDHKFILTEDGTAYEFVIWDIQPDQVVIPDAYNGLPVVSVRGGEPSFFKYVTHIEIPSTVTHIAPGALKYSQRLESITVADGNPVYKSDGNCLIEIATDAVILGCKNSVIPEYVAKIGDHAFYNSALTAIDISESVTEIGDYAFYGCSALTEITLPPFITRIGENTFQNCAALSAIEIPPLVAYIDKYAFEGCSGLASITVADGNPVYKSDGDCLIEITTSTLVLGCKNSVIPEYVTIIGKNAFSGSGLIEFEIPSWVTEVGFAAFSQCKALTSVILPQSITKIESFLFSGCSSLTAVTIPSKVATIGMYAFSETGLTDCVIPISVSVVEQSAFERRDQTMTVYAEAEKKPAGWDEDWNGSVFSAYRTKVVWGYRG